MRVRWTPRLLRAALLCVSVPLLLHAQRDTAGFRTMGRASVGLPLGASVSVAAVRDRRRHSWPSPQGPFVGAEIGALGAAANLGYVSALDGGATVFQASVLQWWGRGQNTYVGTEGRVMVFFASLGAGVYVRVVGDRGPALLPVLTFGFGY